MIQIGDRVGAIMSVEDGIVKLFGYGVYAGKFIPPLNTGGLGPLMHEMKASNPRIDLDNGKQVYGCECWWGPEDKIKETYKDLQIIEIDIDLEREKNGNTD